MDDSLGAGTAYSPSPPVTVNHSAPLSPPPPPPPSPPPPPPPPPTPPPPRPPPPLFFPPPPPPQLGGVFFPPPHLELPDRKVFQEPPAFAPVSRAVPPPAVP